MQIIRAALIQVVVGEIASEAPIKSVESCERKGPVSSNLQGLTIPIPFYPAYHSNGRIAMLSLSISCSLPLTLYLLLSIFCSPFTFLSPVYFSFLTLIYFPFPHPLSNLSPSFRFLPLPLTFGNASYNEVVTFINLLRCAGSFQLIHLHRRSVDNIQK